MSELISGTGKMTTPLEVFTITPGKGVSQSQESQKRTIKADVYLAGIRTQTSMLAVNKSVEYVAEVWKLSYRNESHAAFGGEIYKISSVLPGRDKFRVKLLLTRK